MAGREEGLGPRAQSDLCVEACRARRLLSRRGRLESSNLDLEARGDVTRAAVAGPLERTRLPARCARTGAPPIPATSNCNTPWETINFASAGRRGGQTGIQPKPQIHGLSCTGYPFLVREKLSWAQRHVDGKLDRTTRTCTELAPRTVETQWPGA